MRFLFRETAWLRKRSYNKVWCAPITGRWRNVLEIDQSSSSERAPRSFLSGCRLFLDSSRQLEITKNNFATFTFYQKIKARTNRPLKNFQTSFRLFCCLWLNRLNQMVVLRWHLKNLPEYACFLVLCEFEICESFSNENLYKFAPTTFYCKHTIDQLPLTSCIDNSVIKAPLQS